MADRRRVVRCEVHTQAGQTSRCCQRAGATKHAAVLRPAGSINTTATMQPYIAYGTGRSSSNLGPHDDVHYVHLAEYMLIIFKRTARKRTMLLLAVNRQ